MLKVEFKILGMYFSCQRTTNKMTMKSRCKGVGKWAHKSAQNVGIGLHEGPRLYSLYPQQSRTRLQMPIGALSPYKNVVNSCLYAGASRSLGKAK